MKSKNILIVIIGVLVVLGLGSLYLWNKNNTEKMEKALKTPALDYFDKYMSANTGASAYKVTLGMLKDANEEGENYNLKALNKCEDKTTSATISIDYTNGKVTDTVIKLDCKKF